MLVGGAIPRPWTGEMHVVYPIQSVIVCGSVRSIVTLPSFL